MPPGGFTPIDETSSRSRVGLRAGGYRSQSAAPPSGSVGASNRDELSRLAAGVSAKGRLGESTAGSFMDDDDDDEFMRLEASLGSRPAVPPLRSALTQQQPRAQSVAPPVIAPSMRSRAVTPNPSSTDSNPPASRKTKASVPRVSADADETAEFERLEAELALASARGGGGGGGGGAQRTTERAEISNPGRLQMRRPLRTTTPPPSTGVRSMSVPDRNARKEMAAERERSDAMPDRKERIERAMERGKDTGASGTFSSRGASMPQPVAQTSQPLRFPSPVPRIADTRFLRGDPTPTPTPTATPASPAEGGGKLTFRNRLSSPRGGGNATASDPPVVSNGLKPGAGAGSGSGTTQREDTPALQSSAFSRTALASSAALRSSLTAAPDAPISPKGGATTTSSGLVIPMNIMLGKRAAPPPSIGERDKETPKEELTRQSTMPQFEEKVSRVSEPGEARRVSVEKGSVNVSGQSFSRRKVTTSSTPEGETQTVQTVRRGVRASLEWGETASPEGSRTTSQRHSPASHTSPEANISPESVVVLNPSGFGLSESPARTVADDDIAFLDHIEQLVRNLQMSSAEDNPEIRRLFDDGNHEGVSVYERLCNHILPGLQKQAERLDLTETQRGDLRGRLTQIRDTLAGSPTPEEESWLLSNDSFTRMGESPAKAPTSQPISRRTVPNSSQLRNSASLSSLPNGSEHERDSEKAERSSLPASTSSKNSSVRGKNGGGPIKSLEMKIESQDRKLQRQSQKVNRLQQENSELALRVKALSSVKSPTSTPNSSFHGRTSPGRSDPSINRFQMSGISSPSTQPASRPVTPGAYVNI